jgi:hypothetical protein
MLVQGPGEHGQWSHQDIPSPAKKGDGRAQFEVHENILHLGQGISSMNARGECDC